MTSTATTSAAPLSTPTATVDVSTVLQVAAAPLTGTASGTFPWHQTYREKQGDTYTHHWYAKTLSLRGIPGLSAQLRGTLVQRVQDVELNIRKIPATDATYYAFVASEYDFENVLNSDTASMVTFLQSYPTARPVHTLSTDTTQSDVRIPLIWPIGVSDIVGRPIPPAEPSVILIYIDTNSSFKGKTVQFSIYGTVSVSGWGHLAGYVAAA